MLRITLASQKTGSRPKPAVVTSLFQGTMVTAAVDVLRLKIGAITSRPLSSGPAYTQLARIWDFVTISVEKEAEMGLGVAYCIGGFIVHDQRYSS